MTFSQSHWGVFESPVKIVEPEFGLTRDAGAWRVKYSSPLRYWDGERWVKAE